MRFVRCRDRGAQREGVREALLTFFSASFAWASLILTTVCGVLRTKWAAGLEKEGLCKEEEEHAVWKKGGGRSCGVKAMSGSRLQPSE